MHVLRSVVALLETSGNTPLLQFKAKLCVEGGV